MKNYLVRAIKNFDDTVENVNRRISLPETLEFKCTKERYEFLLEHNAIELIKVEKKGK